MMGLTRSLPVLKILGVGILVVGIFWHESGLRIEERSLLRAEDVIVSRLNTVFKSVFNVSLREDPDKHGDEGQRAASKTTESAAYAKAVNDPQAINVKSYGAKGDGRTDDTQALQRAVNAAPDSGGTVIVPAGVYLVEALESIRLKSGISFYMDKEAVLKAKPNKSERSAVLTIENVSNVQVAGGTIQGERKRHVGHTGQWGTGIQISGAKNVTVEGTASNDCWGDGFYIGTETFIGEDSISKVLAVPENIRLIDVRADNNRRQGISLIAGRNVEIIRPLLTNTKGQDPEGGLDIEPNSPQDVVANIVVVDPVTRGNAGSGILINLAEMAGTKIPASIRITNHRDEESERGLLITDPDIHDVVVPGTVLIENPQWINSQKNGLAIRNHDDRSYSIVIKDPQITNANRRGFRFDPVFGSAIAIYHELGNVPSRTGVIGNVTIQRPVLSDTGTVSKTLAPFYIGDEVTGRTMRKISIVDPVIKGSLLKINIGDLENKYIQYTLPPAN